MVIHYDSQEGSTVLSMNCVMMISASESIKMIVIVMCYSNSTRDSQTYSDGEKSGGMQTTSGSTGPGYYANVDLDEPNRAQLPSERGVDLFPDSRQASKSNGYAASGESDTAGNVPVPLRVTKKRRPTQSRGDASASDMSVGSADLAPGMTSTLRGTGSGPQAYTNVSYEADTPEGQRRQKQPGATSDKERKKKRQRGTGTVAGTADPIRDPVMRNIAAQQQQLRVHIKAQPGTAVHITPSGTPTTRPGQDQAPAYHARPPTVSGQPPTYQNQPRPQHPTRPFSGADSETEI